MRAPLFRSSPLLLLLLLQEAATVHEGAVEQSDAQVWLYKLQVQVEAKACELEDRDRSLQELQRVRRVLSGGLGTGGSVPHTCSTASM